MKKQYNQALKSYKNAENYMDNPNISLERKIKRVPEVQEITRKLSNLLNIIKTYNIDEALNGFKNDEQLNKAIEEYFINEKEMVSNESVTEGK
jgi:hypothetical protein